MCVCTQGFTHILGGARLRQAERAGRRDFSIEAMLVARLRIVVALVGIEVQASQHFGKQIPQKGRPSLSQTCLRGTRSNSALPEQFESGTGPRGLDLTPKKE
ncbi:hypothetical protein HRR83_003818 [Exophiala dermatitidis]|uniref:Uncharacterized protein n=1 Tax=Exophiala dermatitidis TaxID=5970 RepID=A0AAN6EY12_EXODE|nr:hypothetical protein HRR74_002800 [Exophiala dermatitidis]KAJ4529544.1 hypothetical protein HRR73_000569 [Exophiala dermatitidis]KAJ4543297.1 hypothetical protein HRR77_005550 [Exophiala dermatitidis]KAJ4543796.1 hypothetical protein HRR76_001858 [Exophiala dermatitidis]KAJ4575261.1 hypothetical protein HRR79_002188 [Exophiala dermatitidis]